jgi:hypothetical protein
MIEFSKTGRGEPPQQVGCDVPYPVDVSIGCITPSHNR